MKINRFRAFDKATNKMVATGFHLIGEVTMFKMVEQYIDENRCGANSSLERLNDIVEMQWTGLQDKNKQDIYEGDVIVNETGNNYVVEFNEGSYYKYHTSLGDELLVYDIDKWKVIGNIWENPELMMATDVVLVIPEELKNFHQAAQVIPDGFGKIESNWFNPIAGKTVNNYTNTDNHPDNTHPFE